MDSKQLEYTLKLWDQAGPRPYEILQEEDLLDNFMILLYNSKYKLGDKVCISRVTSRHRACDVGSVIMYNYATSWSFNYNYSKNIVDNLDNQVIISLSSEQEISAIINNQNSYKEPEIILYPIKLVVVSREVCNGIIILNVRPVTN